MLLNRGFISYNYATFMIYFASVSFSFFKPKKKKFRSVIQTVGFTVSTIPCGETKF